MNGMLDFIGQSIGEVWGPARLFSSFFFLAACGATASVVATLYLLPKTWHLLPRDRGRAYAVDADKSVGKPVSAGIIMVSIFIGMGLLFVPFEPDFLLMLPVIAFSSIIGFIDDRSRGLSELALGSADLVTSLAAALILFGLDPMVMWFPFVSGSWMLPAWIGIPIVTTVIWVAINAMNCNDGVDGLSGSLASVCFAFLGILLYTVIGNVEVSKYLLIPHNPDGATWALASAVMIGCIFGYLWYNVPPSSVLMGDSGSRPIGLMLGVLVSVGLNPFLLVVCGFIILANGATGLAKLALLRVFKVGIFRTISFPLHDHCRKKLGWAGSQVLLRFLLIHIAVSALMIALLLKVR
jgi:phospho-N-acetylmuramoyl-pentapeptide-transferase